jgi:hypothetical protein
MFVQINPLHLLQAIHLRPAAKEGVIDHPTPSRHIKQSAVPLHLEESSPVRSCWTAEVAVDALDLARRSHVLVCQRDIANTNMAKVLWEVLWELCPRSRSALVTRLHLWHSLGHWDLANSRTTANSSVNFKQQPETSLSAQQPPKQGLHAGGF